MSSAKNSPRKYQFESENKFLSNSPYYKFNNEDKKSQNIDIAQYTRNDYSPTRSKLESMFSFDNRFNS